MAFLIYRTHGQYRWVLLDDRYIPVASANRWYPTQRACLQAIGCVRTTLSETQFLYPAEKGRIQIPPFLRKLAKMALWMILGIQR